MINRVLLACAVTAAAVALLSWWAPPRAEAAGGEAGAAAAQDRAARLMMNYPSVKAVRDNVVLFADGTTLPYDDREAKGLAEKLKNADIEDHFAQPYPAFAPIAAPALHDDPGRFRNDALLKKLYGGSKSEVEANLVEVVWLPTREGRRILFNKKENAAAQLQKVSNELDGLPEEYMKYLRKIDGTYQYRPIEGTTRLSPHSYGIAIDLNLAHTVYWLWDKEYRYRNEIPQKVVEIFEKHGFVWGGRWYHYDTMHFEYRPEMFERVF